MGIVLLIMRRTSEKSVGIQNKETSSEISKAADENKTSDCSGEPTISSTEGPYYKTGSPRRTDITASAKFDKLVLEGFVFNTNCVPVANAWIDFWQADGNGNYDNRGYNFRGHQYTDKSGKYTLNTVIPREYPGRTPHIHVKVRANENSLVLTTQLYFPGQTRNETDSIFRDSLVVDLIETETGKVARFNFIINTNQ